ncbi:MAG: hypothetical protein EOO03_02775 [Chitinophagaceae bacterium]|nr:MAG: hypothetical protein EOO03_02775 [Chitinophagaceae bacterium]
MKPFLPNCFFKAGAALLCLAFLQKTAFSQHLEFGNEKFKIEAGLNFGPSFFLGDLGGNYGKGTHFLKDLNLEETRLMKGAFVSVYPADWIGFRVAAQITYLSGDDMNVEAAGSHETFRKERNLDFKSNVWEAYTAVELFPLMMFNKYNDYDPRLKPYGLIGVGLFKFNPKGSLTTANGSKTWHELQPLRTEGQGMTEYPGKEAYKLTQINIPMGLGIKYQLSERVNIGTEFLYRKTFTDYIDDVSTTYIDPIHFENYLSNADAVLARKLHDKSNSLTTPANRTIPGEQRGNSKNMDSYFSTVLKLGVRLGAIYGSSADRNAARQTRCPMFY